MNKKILSTVNTPADIRTLGFPELALLAAEMREEIIATVARTGGHLAPSLGAVELAIAIHFTFKTPDDILIWDVGHQSYAHKLLTGRAKSFSTLRQLGGISGFPNREESPAYDLFTCGHSSTSISAALGMAAARDLSGGKHKVVAVIGDAALAGGMAFEALNHAGQAKRDLVVILNDNELSISRSVGALSRYLNRIIANPAYNKIRRDVENVLMRIPRFGFRAYRAARKLEEGLKNLLIPGMLFEELGFRYFGPIDGHNIEQLVRTFKNLMDLNEPILIHVVTKKGKGYKYAEDAPSAFHGTGPYDVATGKKAERQKAESFTEAFGAKIVDLAMGDPRIVAVTAAMVDGTGLDKFAALFPKRFFDVGISEEHAIGYAAGLARGGFKPVVAVYSTFLQRGYDQIIHDVCLQNLPVIFCLDRAGLVGEDGPTHHGAFDIAYLRHIPDIVLMAPASPDELKEMLGLAVQSNKPVAIRYPKGATTGTVSNTPVIMGKADMVKKGDDIAILAVGTMVETAMSVARLLFGKKVSASVVNMRFIKPFDEELLMNVLKGVKRVVTLEEGVLDGGFGSAVLEFIEREKIEGVRLIRIGLPDIFIEHGKREELFVKYHLTPEAIYDVIIADLLK